MASGRAFRKIYKIYSLTYSYIRQCNRLEREFGKIPAATLDQLKRDWANEVLDILNCQVEIRGSLPQKKRTLFVGNHISYLDIPLLMGSASVVFVAKSELARWPAIGQGCKRLGTIFVNRSSYQSRRAVASQLTKELSQKNKNIAIFPSGTSHLHEPPWRHGAFRIAQHGNIPVQPFRIWYEPARKCAYMDRDFFPWQLFQLASLKEVRAIIEFAKPFRVDHPHDESLKWHDWCEDRAFRGMSNDQVSSGSELEIQTALGLSRSTQ